MTLTVTDDDGATGTISHPITVTAAPPANVAPTAEFTSSANNLDAAFTSTSTDTDGTIAGYSWNFGDATPAGTVANPTHTYAAAGTYTVTLTVTDDDGATGTINHPITVTAPAPQALAADTFGRTITNGLGVADVGGAWTIAGTASNFAVADGRASMNVAAAGGSATGVSELRLRRQRRRRGRHQLRQGRDRRRLLHLAPRAADRQQRLPTQAPCHADRDAGVPRPHGGRSRDPVLGSVHRARDLHRRQRRPRSAAGGRHRDDDAPSQGVVHDLERTGGLDAHHDRHHREPAGSGRGRHLHLRVRLSDERCR